MLEVFCIFMYFLVLKLSSFLVCTHIGEMGKDERRDNVYFSSFWFTIDFLPFYQNIDGVYWVWGRLIFQRAQAPVVNYLKANVSQAPLHSRIWTCKLNNRVGDPIWFSPLHLLYEHESSIGGYEGPTMYRGEHESLICGYKGPTMFWPRPFGDFGSGLGEFRDFPGPQHLICVSLGTSQVLWHLFGLFMYLFGL